MSDELASRRLRAQSSNYVTDANLARRQALSAYAVTPGKMHQKLSDLFKWQTDATILDLGCGNGVWASTAAEVTPLGAVIGLDNSVGMLTALRNRTRDVIPILGDGHRLPFRSGSLDAVLALWVLYHLRDKAAVLGEVKRTLRTGGLFIAATNSSAPVEVVDDLIMQGLEKVTGRTIDSWIAPLDFTIENGQKLMESHFDNVDLIVSEAEFEIPNPEPLLDFAESLRSPIEAEVGPDLQFDSFLEAFRSLLEEHLSSGPIRFRRRSGYFVAR